MKRQVSLAFGFGGKMRASYFSRIRAWPRGTTRPCASTGTCAKRDEMKRSDPLSPGGRQRQGPSGTLGTRGRPRWVEEHTRKPSGKTAGVGPVTAAQCADQLRAEKQRGAWVAQSVRRPTSAQVRISRFVSSSPRVGLWADSSEPGACFGFCVSLCCLHSVSCIDSKINKRLKKFF